MKMTIVADLHLNKNVYKGVMDDIFKDLSFRSADFMRAFESIVDTNINNIRPDLFIILGDIYDTFDPSNSIRSFFNQQLKKLTENKIPIIMISGNHDCCCKHSALSPLSALDLKSVKVIENPKVINFKDSVLMFFPYSKEVEQGKILIREQLISFAEETKEKLKDNNKTVFFFGHFPVKGAKLNSYISNEDHTTRKLFFNKKETDISVDDIDNIGAKYVFLGDFHEFQILSTKKCFAMYSGSIEKTDMSEIDQKKGFIVYDDNVEEDEKMGKCRFVEYETCRPMIELKGKANDIIKDIEKIQGQTNGAIVKVSFIGNEKELEEFSSKLDLIKTQIKRKVQPIHLFHEQKVVDENTEKELEDIENKIIEQGHMDENDVMDAVTEMINEKEKNEDERKVLVDMALKIYKTMIEEK